MATDDLSKRPSLRGYIDDTESYRFPDPKGGRPSTPTVLSRRPTTASSKHLPRPTAPEVVLGEDSSDSGSEETIVEEAPSEKPNEVGWQDDDDATNPVNFTKAKKIKLFSICIILTLSVSFASSAPSAATHLVAAEFHVSELKAVFFTTSIFLLGFVLGPIVWAPLSELYGRRPVFVGTMWSYTLLQLGPALGKSMGTLYATRFLGGVFASSPLANAGGVVADLFDPVTRGIAMSLFSGSVFLGPVMGPIASGFIEASYLGWRFIFYCIMILALVTSILVTLLLPETFAPVILVQKAKHLRNITGNAELYAPHEKTDFSPRALLDRTLLKPFIMLSMEPILVCVTLFMSIVYGVLYALFSVIPIIFEGVYGFNAGESGLVFIGLGIGTTVGSFFNIWLQRHYKTITPQWKNLPPPEERLWGAMYSGLPLVAGIFWIGWTGYKADIPWPAPACATLFIGFSFTLIFISFLSYLVEVYLFNAASALAANSVFRSCVGAAFPLFITQMYHGWGIEWATTFFGCVAILCVPLPFIFYRYGARIRELSRYAPAMDIEYRKQIIAAGRLGKRGHILPEKEKSSTSV